MKFKSAEADWNISFVSQQAEGRNWRVLWCGSCIDATHRGGCTEGVMEVETCFGKRMPMKRYLKFAASFWMSAFLIAGSMAGAQTTSTAKAKKSGSSTTPAPATNATNSGQSAATASTNAASAPQTNATAHDQSGGTNATTTTTPATTTPAPKTMIGPDKHTILVPQL